MVCRWRRPFDSFYTADQTWTSIDAVLHCSVRPWRIRRCWERFRFTDMCSEVRRLANYLALPPWEVGSGSRSSYPCRPLSDKCRESRWSGENQHLYTRRSEAEEERNVRSMWPVVIAQCHLLFDGSSRISFLPSVHVHFFSFFLGQCSQTFPRVERSFIHSFSLLVKQIDVHTLLRTYLDLCFHHNWDGWPTGETCSATPTIATRSTSSSSI